MSDFVSIQYRPCGPLPKPPSQCPCYVCPCTNQSKNPIRYVSGGLILPQDDLAVPSGSAFAHTRYYCNQASSSYAGPNGYNWWIGLIPYIADDVTAVAVTIDPNNPYWFDDSGGIYTPRYGMIDVSLVEDLLAQTLTFTNNTGGHANITVFNSFSTATAPGEFVSNTDAQGVVTAVTSRTGSQIQEIQRTYSSGGSTITESLLYTYYSSGSAMGNIQYAEYRRKVGSGSWTSISRATYVYYGTSDTNGSLNDLMTATQQLPDGSGGWNSVGVQYYRYYLGTETTGIFHGLKMHFGPEAYRRMFNDGIDLSTASDATVLPYADHYYEFDPDTCSVTKEIAAVCDSCPGGGTTSDLFTYTLNPSNPSPGYNVWSMKTEQTLPDSSKIIVYSNYAGMTMLMVTVDPAGTSQWCTFYRYSSDGLLIWTAHPSAVNGYDDTYDDLMNYDGGTSLYQYLNNSTGLIEVTDYYSTTGSGAVTGYVQNRSVRQGQSGSDVLVRSFTYASNTDSSGNTVFPVATAVSYPDASTPATTITTSYSYTWYSGTNQMSQKTTTLPVVSTGQNGSNTAATIVEAYDIYGNLTERTDERGIVNDYTYADPVLSAMTQQTLNVQSGVTAPGINAVTDFTYDDRGRLIQSLGPSHGVDLSGTATTVRRASWMVYNQSVEPLSGTWDVDQTWSGMGYATGTGPSYTYTLVDPVSITGADKNGRTTDQIASKRTTGSGALSDTDTFAQTDWQSWTSLQYDAQGHLTSQCVYFDIPSSGTGSVGTNYGETDYGYDALERQNRVATPGGTITRTVWTTPQWVASVWVGTDDTGATDSNPAGSGSPNNMVIVTANQYDGGSDGGDGNLTQVTQYAAAADTRVTSYGYDFRDRRTSMDGEIDVYAAYTYDNLDRMTQTDRYDTTSGGNLIGRSVTKYDDRGRVYQTLTYAVDPSTGTVGNALTANTWFDDSGNVLQQINAGDGQVFSKFVYNGMGWTTASYRGYNTSGTSYSQAGTVSNDTIFSQSENTYDEAGNVVSTASYDRLNDAPATGTGSTGALTYGSDPKARVSYTATWYDGIDRSIASANYGAITSFTRPSTTPTASDTVLVSLTTYDDAGRMYQTGDPEGLVTQRLYDDAGRTTQKIEALGSGVARTTNFTYTLDNQIATLTAVNPDTDDQITTYLYGTTLSDSDIARNDLLQYVVYPNSTDDAWSTLTVDQWADMTVPGWSELLIDPETDRVEYTYNGQGQQTSTTDQRGTVRSMLYDKLGRPTDDCVTTVGSDTDNAVLRISTAYEVRGMVLNTTSYDNATVGSGSVLNQVKMTYNSFSQLTKQEQDHSGAVGGSTPSVQYAYATGGSSSNQIRMTSMTYPNARVLTYDYGTSGGVNDRLNRLDTIQDTTSSTTDLASYTYLGDSTVVRITYPQPSVWLDLWGGTSGTFAGLDRFNRIIDQRWQDSITGTPTDIDRYKYGYDRDSNRTWKQNTVGSNFDEFYTYDDLNRLTRMQRGILTGTPPTGISGIPVKEQDWTLDPLGNWNGFLTKTSGTTDLNQTRVHDKDNQIVEIGGMPAWATPPEYDAAGNMKSFPQPSTPANAFGAVYDAWDRLKTVTDGANTVAEFEYAGNNWRTVKKTYTSGTITETRHAFYTNRWQNIEERTGTSTTADLQYVWGIRFVDELICRDDATTPQRLYACQDANFNLTSITDDTGAVQERYVFTPYGGRSIYSPTWTTRSTSSDAWVVGHQGLILDVNTRLIYNRHRMFNVELGRFLQRDPLEYADGFNLYLLEGNVPTTRLDPSGQAQQAYWCSCQIIWYPDPPPSYPTKAEYRNNTPASNTWDGDCRMPNNAFTGFPGALTCWNLLCSDSNCTIVGHWIPAIAKIYDPNPNASNWLGPWHMNSSSTEQMDGFIDPVTGLYWKANGIDKTNCIPSPPPAVGSKITNHKLCECGLFQICIGGKCISDGGPD